MKAVSGRGRKWTFDLEACRPLIGQTNPQEWPLVPDQVAADPDSHVGTTFLIWEKGEPKRARLNSDQTLSKI
jgi:hypothetical protein